MASTSVSSDDQQSQLIGFFQQLTSLVAQGPEHLVQSYFAELGVLRDQANTNRENALELETANTTLIRAQEITTNEKNKEIEKLGGEKATLESKLENSEREKIELHGEISQLQTENEQLRAFETSCRRLSEETNTLKLRLGELRTQNSQYSKSVAEKDGEISRLKQDMGALEKKIQEKEKRMREIQSYSRFSEQVDIKFL